MTEAVSYCDISCELGEGPTYDPADGTTWWFDITASKLLERGRAAGPATVHDLPLMASALGIIDEARQLLVTETGLHVRDRASGRLALHAAIEADDPNTRSNDARVHPSGAFWIGTMAKDHKRGAGAIYWHRGGETRPLYSGISIPNSICFSPDGSIAYFADTPLGRLMRVACDPLSGLPLGAPEVFLDLADEAGFIDGSVCDAEGCIWNARWGAGVVERWSPSGERLGRHAIPASQPSCPALAGPEGRDLVVTTAREGLDDRALASDSQAGRTFVLRGIAPGGRFEPRVVV